MAKQNLGGVYAGMDFPPYEWKEYPKHVAIGPHGQTKIVQSAEEEQKLRAELQSEQDNEPAQQLPHVADPTRAILISRAREIGAAINPNWSITKLKSTIEAAEADLDSLPPETLVTTKATHEAAPEVPVLHNQSPDDQKAELIERLKELDPTAKNLHLWGIPRLKAAIAEQEAK